MSPLIGAFGIPKLQNDLKENEVKSIFLLCWRAVKQDSLCLGVLRRVSQQFFQFLLTVLFLMVHIGVLVCWPRRYI